VSDYGLAIFPQHAALLAASAISPEVARERGYVSVDTRARLDSPGFAKWQQRVPGLLIPVHDTSGAVATWQYRPDSPRTTKAGKVIKYETPSGSRLVLDVPPRVRAQLGDPAVALWITEGARKADAAVSAGLACIGLSGVDGWRGTNGQGGKTALPAWNDIALNGRRIYLAFDSDAASNPNVAGALQRLGGYLGGKADVRFCYLPAGDDGAKVGLDDYLAAGGDTKALVETSTPRLVIPVQAELPGDDGAPAVAEDSATATLEGEPAELLDALHKALTRYVILPSPESADAIVLWITATHAAQAWNCAPRLDVTSPVKRCGKSRLLDIIEATCHNPLLTVNISPAALVRSISDDPPTLLLDEADTVFGPKAADNHEDLRGILNAGHSRNRPYIRWDVAARGPEHCPTFALAALAGIGALPDTITDRAIVVKMRRRAPGEVVDRYRDRRDGAPLKELGKRLGRWIRAHIAELREAEPEMPVEDRAADTWEPLIAVADLAGGDWPIRARKAATALTDEDGTDTTLGARLLADLRDVFGDADAMHGESILTALHKISEAPWGDYFGRPLAARDMAKLLKPYEVASVDVKIDGVNRKGYRREHLHDPWTRYLPPLSGGSATWATYATAQVNEGAPVAGSACGPLPATGAMPLTSDVAEVAQEADTLPERAIQDGRCKVCGEPLDQALIDAGYRTHGEDEPA
jgi:Protein of unknown function (DUF3631)/Domain of unknown function (DUF3854)